MKRTHITKQNYIFNQSIVETYITTEHADEQGFVNASGQSRLFWAIDGYGYLCLLLETSGKSIFIDDVTIKDLYDNDIASEETTAEACNRILEACVIARSIFTDVDAQTSIDFYATIAIDLLKKPLITE